MVSRPTEDDNLTDDNYSQAVRMWHFGDHKNESMAVKNASMFRNYLYTQIIANQNEF